MVFAYVANGTLRVSVDVDEAAGLVTGEDGNVRLWIQVGGGTVFPGPGG